jgi:phosphatidylserine/phosphatidylglycerophosphate/cardiolipin synthase-like enzyme
MQWAHFGIALVSSNPGGVAFYAYAQKETGTTEIYQHTYNPDDSRYYYDQKQKNKYNWTPGWVAFYAYASKVADTFPVYQQNNIATPTYYRFTTASEVQGYKNEGIAFYAYPPDFLGIIDEIERTLARKPDKSKGVTYLRRPGNKFTLLDTPGLWGKEPTAGWKMSAACQTFLDTIADVIGNAEQTLDIALLFNADPTAGGFPSGGFQDAISRGFKRLSDKGKKPGIRILLGAPLDPNVWKKTFPMPPLPILMPIPALISKYYAGMKDWLVNTIKLHQPIDAMKCPVQMGLNSPGTWNHAKIIVADDKRVITGGHNFWAPDYLGRAPMHDVSGLFEGPVAQAARQFCDKLWGKATHTICLIAGKDSPLPPPRVVIGDPPPPVGNVEMLSLGRLGKGLLDFSIGSNASVTARIVALCKAKSFIGISQQSLLGIALNPYDFYTCLAIVRAVRAGVNVQIVLSNELPNYGGSAPNVLKQLQWLYVADVEQTYDQCKNAPPRDHIDAWADLAAGPNALCKKFGPLPPSKKARVAEFNNKLKLATLYYSDNQTRWLVQPSPSTKIPAKWTQAGNHSKVYIIDEDCFYVGSDNFYPSLNKEGLQEFGYLIEDKNETKKFKSEYWDKLWQYSKNHPLN